MDRRNKHHPSKIKIEISANSLAKAMANGSIAASDIKGLNIHAKQSLWRLCLDACIASKIIS